MTAPLGLLLALSLPARAGVVEISLGDFQAAMGPQIADLHLKDQAAALGRLEAAAFAPPAADPALAARSAAAQTLLTLAASPDFLSERGTAADRARIERFFTDDQRGALESTLHSLQTSAIGSEAVERILARARARLLPGVDDGRPGRVAYALEALFDGSEGGGGASLPAERRRVARPPLSRADRARLLNLSGLGEDEYRGLAERLARTPWRLRGALPFPEDMTFSLELEFLANRQISEKDLSSWFTGPDPLHEGEWASWRRDETLRPGRWLQARNRAVARAEAELPPGWGVTNESLHEYGNTWEIRTSSRGRKYHRNTPDDWDSLVAALERAQAGLPGGLFSAHIHLGQESATTANGRLLLNDQRFTRLFLLFEAHWRALFGVPFQSWRLLAHQNLNPAFRALGNSVYNHGTVMNKSAKWPTLENKLLSGLLEVSQDDAQRLDPESLREQVWPFFSFFRAAVSPHDDLPLVSLGLPLVPGQGRSTKLERRFLDAVFSEDVAGKAVALRRLERSAAGRPAVDRERARNALSSLRRDYEMMGLALIFDLHAEHGGWDEDLTNHLLARDRAPLKDLAADLKAHHVPRETALSFFPEALRKELAPLLP